jgi:AcrR family transcriptional regulator
VARREAIGARLLAAVESLLAEPRSFTDLTVEEIIERAGVPRSTFYYHFHDKADLLVAVSADALREIVEASRALYADAPRRSRAEFTAAVRRTVQTWRGHVPVMNAVAELAAYDADVKGPFLAGWDAARQEAEDYIRAGQRDGDVRPDLHPAHVAGWLTWMAERGISQLVAAADEQEFDAIVEGLATIVWHTFYPDHEEHSR